MTALTVDPGSFRDPGGQVFLVDGRVYRTVNEPALADYEFVEESGLIEQLVERGWLVGSTRVDADSLSVTAPVVLEHPRIPLISYPYEWSFTALKRAALLHLDIHLAALERGVTLSDATAYNVQFVGPKPIFIDRLSFVRYVDGEIWTAHRQFCEQFLNPLLLRAYMGVQFNQWYRGSLEGVPVDDMAKLLPFWRKMAPKTLIHITLQSAFQSRGGRPAKGEPRKGRLPKHGLTGLLRGLRRWIERLEPLGGKTVWEDYAGDNSYEDTERERKKAFIRSFVGQVEAKQVWDFGCNTGDYLMAALDGGAEYGVGFDFDQGALEKGFLRAEAQKLPLHFLFLDATNPSPSQGWAECERMGLTKRTSADMLLGLAFIHHLAIAKNIPLPGLIDWMLGMAPNGVIEFVPKSDPMVGQLLRNRKDIFPNYTFEDFRSQLDSRAKIVNEDVVSKSGRTLLAYTRV